MAKKGDDPDDDARVRRSMLPTRLPGESEKDYDARRARAATVPPVAQARERARTVGVDQPLTVLLGERQPEGKDGQPKKPKRPSFLKETLPHTVREWGIFIAGTIVGVTLIVIILIFVR